MKPRVICLIELRNQLCGCLFGSELAPEVMVGVVGAIRNIDLELCFLLRGVAHA